MKTIEEIATDRTMTGGGIPTRYQLKCDEVIYLKDNFNYFDMIAIAFNYGFFKGSRYQKNKRRKKAVK